MVGRYATSTDLTGPHSTCAGLVFFAVAPSVPGASNFGASPKTTHVMSVKPQVGREGGESFWAIRVVLPRKGPAEDRRRRRQRVDAFENRTIRVEWKVRDRFGAKPDHAPRVEGP